MTKRGSPILSQNMTKMCSRFLIRNFRLGSPSMNFLAEEDGIRQNLATVIVSLSIRPIAPTNFIFDYKFSCVSVGLAWKGRCSSALCTIHTEELYTAVKGEVYVQERKADPQQWKRSRGNLSWWMLWDIIQMIRARRTAFSDMQNTVFHTSRIRSSGSAALGYFRRVASC